MHTALDAGNDWRSTSWRIAAWSTGSGLMLLPIAAGLLTDDFGWSAGDFIFFGLLLVFGCLLFDLAARKAHNLAYCAAAGAALATAMGLVFVNGAVGLVGSEQELHNLLFLVGILVAATGAVVTRGRSAAMSRVMLAAAATHMVVSVSVLIGFSGRSAGDPRAEIAGLAIFAAAWLASAGLFRVASRRPGDAR